MDDHNAHYPASLKEVKDIQSFSILFETYLKDFGTKDPEILRIFKKVIRIVEALYLVSDSIPLGESLRTEIRSQGLSLTDMTFSFALDKDTVSESKCLQGLARLGWLVQMAYVSKYLSRTSTELLQNAFVEVQSRIRNVRGSIPEDFLRIDEDVVSSKVIARHGDRVRREDSGVAREVSPKASERRGAILTFLRENPKVNVKEVLSVVPGVSEKTVQRELLALVDEGVLKKEGERRWTQYSLN